MFEPTLLNLENIRAHSMCFGVMIGLLGKCSLESTTMLEMTFVGVMLCTECPWTGQVAHNNIIIACNFIHSLINSCKASSLI